MVATIEQAITLLADSARLLVFTGAGISTESGIPDFRGPSGLWKTADPKDFTLENYVTSRYFRESAWQRRFESPLRHAQPNTAHLALVDLWRRGRMIGCVTQNIDGLHHKAGLPVEGVAELHGNPRSIRCVNCAAEADSADIERRWRGGDADPRCEECGGILKSTVVYFGEMLPEVELAKAATWADRADAVIAIGSTLSVYPAANVTLDVAGRDRPFLIVNEGPTDQDRIATLRLEGRAGDLVPRLVAGLIS